MHLYTPPPAGLDEVSGADVGGVDFLGSTANAHVRVVRGVHVRHGHDHAYATGATSLPVDVGLAPLVQNTQQRQASCYNERLLFDGNRAHTVEGGRQCRRTPYLHSEITLDTERVHKVSSQYADGEQ